jgi:hypothetical protein
MSADPVMRFEIRPARNGWILKVEESQSKGGEAAEVVYEEKYDDEVECFADFLRTLEEEFGPSTNRYSPKRIYIRIEPGDKFEDLNSPAEPP